MRRNFDNFISSLVSKKRCDNNAFLSTVEYNARIADVKHSKFVLSMRGVKKTPRDYRVVQKYEIVNVNGEERLVKPGTGLYYVVNDELFDILHAAHISVNHGGRNKMLAEIKAKYCNVTIECIMVYLNLCIRCRQKRLK